MDKNIDTIEKLKTSKYFEMAKAPDAQERVDESLDDKIERVSGPIKRLINEIKILYRMITDKGYAVSAEVKVTVIAGLLYFISPIDLIPDFIPIIGYLDDATVIGLVIKFLSDDIKNFKNYLAGLQSASKLSPARVENN